MPDLSSLPTDKQTLRRVMAATRAEACAQNPDAPKALCDNVLKHIPLSSGSIVAGYSAQKGEMDVGPLMAALAARGHAMALPVMVARDVGLEFRFYKSGDALLPGMMEIPEPPATAPQVEPDVILVPLLAFDRRYNRLGTGGGYYDRTLAALRQKRPLLALGIGFACQEVHALPAEKHDIRLDRIATEIEVF
jgi:5-formyltetrahydrofolate cyclo-ligase